MKQMKLISNLGESETLIELKKISDKLLKLGKISKGDEIVVESEFEGDKPTFTLNVDLIKPGLNDVKADLKKLGTIQSDQKLFDDDPDDNPNPENSSENAPENNENKSSEEEEKEVTLHDAKDLLFDLGSEEFDDFSKLSDQLVSKYSKKPESVSLADIEEKYEDFLVDQGKGPRENISRHNYAKAAKETYDKITKAWRTTKNFDDLMFDTNNENNNNMSNINQLLFDDEELRNPEVQTFDSLYFEDVKDPENNKDPEDNTKKSCEKDFDDLLFDESGTQHEVKNFDDLLFDESETKTEVKNFDTLLFDESETQTEIKTFDTLLFDESETKTEVKDFDTLLFDVKLNPAEMRAIHACLEKFENKHVPYTPEEVSKECGYSAEKVKEAMRYFDDTNKEEAEKKIKEFCEMVKDGKQLSPEQKEFCNSAKKYFTEEELKEFCGDVKLFEEDKKENTPEKPAEEHKEESRDELIRRLNKESEETTLLGAAKASVNKIK